MYDIEKADKVIREHLHGHGFGIKPHVEICNHTPG